jgi:hypothetical protein
MYKPTIWQFTGSAVRANYDSMLPPTNPDWLVVRLQDRSNSSWGSAGIIGEYFSIALHEELEARGLAAERVAMRTLTRTERLRSGVSRARVELDVIVEIPKGNPNQLIDALSTAKQRCLNASGATVKVVMKAELKMGPLRGSSAIERNSIKQNFLEQRVYRQSRD